ncbi:unnamed protein product [Camellia sinensis]
MVGCFPSFIALDVGSILPRYASPDLSGDCVGRSGKFLGYSLLTQNGQQNALVIFVRGVALDLQELDELLEEVQEARRIKLLHQPSKVIDMEHELQALRMQIREKSIISVKLQRELLFGANKSIYAPEPFDVGRFLEVDVVSAGQKVAVTTSGPIGPAAGLASYVETLLRKPNTEFNTLKLPYQIVAIVSGALNDTAAKKVNRFQSKEGRGREDSDAHLVTRILGRPWHFQSNNTSQSKGQLCVVRLEDFGAEHKQVMELPCPINTPQNVSSRGSLLIRIAPAVEAPFFPN